MRRCAHIQMMLLPLYYCRVMVFLKPLLFFAVFLGFLVEHTHSLTNCSLDKYCQPYESDWWKYRSEVCFNCGAGKRYHCARDYDSKEVFRQGCAEEKFCPQGEEPNLSYLVNGKPVTEPTVYCEPCHDIERYNSERNTSSAEYSECPDTKWNKCTEDRHKILCKPDDSTDERYCRCDARNGFSPVNDFSYEKCSYKDYDCRDYKKCADNEDLLLNYTCAPKCPDGFGRLDKDTDDCKLLPTVETKISTVPFLESTDSKRTTLPTSPKSTVKPVQGCVEECHEYKVCVDGKCVCPDNCTSVKEPVCGHHAGLKSEFKTFPSICELKRSYCTGKKFIFHSNGVCPKEKTKLQAIWIIFVVLFSFLLILLTLCIIFKTKIGRQCRNRLSRGRETSGNISGHQLIAVTVDGNQTDGNQANGNQADGKQANGEPLNETSDTNRPKSKQSQKKERKVIINNVTNYYSPVVQSEGGQTHISFMNGSDGVTVKYNKEQKQDGEDDPLLSGDCDTDRVQSGLNKDSREQIAQPITANKSSQLRSDPVLNPTLPNEAISAKKNGDVFENIEADSYINKTEHLPVTVNKQLRLSRTYRKRKNSASHESLFLEPNITDITEETKESDECKDVINKVMDRSTKYLVDNMDPNAIIDRFNAKEILTYNKRRDITDFVTQSKQNREIIKSIRETGAHNYQALKSSLGETKQFECLQKLEDIQKEVIKEKQQNLLKPVEEREGPCFVAPEETLEEKAFNFLKEFQEVKKIYDGTKYDDRENLFRMFVKICNYISEQFPDLKQTIVTKELPERLPVQEEYRNTPEGFQAYRSSGKDNSCLYQSICLLLTGTEDLQCCLRLLATMHAVREYPTYKKQLQLLDAERRKLLLFTMLRQNHDIGDSEDVDDKMLKTLIMETPFVGTDSSALHVAILSGTLGMYIHQHFQHSEDNGAKVVEILKDVQIPDCFMKPGLPELHVFWVNMKNEENGPLNHFVPLLPKTSTIEEKS